MGYKISKLGWLPDPLDHRDWTLRSSVVSDRLQGVVPQLSRGIRPKAPISGPAGNVLVDLRPWCSPIEDQGQVGSCTANAVVGALEYYERKLRGEHVDGSRLFLYKVTRRYLGWDGRGDTGAFVRSAIKALRLFGVAPEEAWPYSEAEFDAEPQAFHYAFAQNFRAIEYFRVPEEPEQLKGVLNAGLPFAFGFTCFESLFHPEVERTGVIPYPHPRDSVAGGHAVLAVGYTDTHVLIRNSWGERWGDHGYGYLPWTYFDEAQPLATDCWSLVNADFTALDAREDDHVAARRSAPRVAAAVDGRPRTARRNATGRAGATQPLIRVSRGSDPIRSVPLRVTSSGVVPMSEGTTTTLATSDKAVSLYLRSLTLKESFDFALFGRATNELYLLAVTWDLSGKPPVVFPMAATQAVKGVYRAKEGDRVKFVGDGIQLWPSQKVVGGLYVRLFIMENDDDVRAAGKRLEQVATAVGDHQLAAALAALAAGPTAAAITAVATAATKLASIIGGILATDGDDMVALFDGTYGAERLTTTRMESYEQAGAAIELELSI